MTIPPVSGYAGVSEYFEGLDLFALGVKKDAAVDAGLLSLIDAVKHFEFEDEHGLTYFECAMHCLGAVGFLTFSAHSRGEASEFYQFRKILNRHTWSHYLVSYKVDVAVVSYSNRIRLTASDAVREAVDWVCTDPGVLARMVMTK